MHEVAKARGHVNVSAKHKNTLEFTKEDYLTPTGDCIIAIESDKAMPELSPAFKAALKNKDARLKITIECEGLTDVIIACGHPNLILTHPTDLVVRKSKFICPRTLAIRSDKGACDLDRSLIARISEGFDVSVRLEIYSINTIS